MSNNQQCKGKIDNFCYVCGHYTPANDKQYKQGFSIEFLAAYEGYFGQKVIENERWVPNTVCKTCNKNLLDWTKKKIDSMPFGVPMVWRDPGDHDASACYMCVNNQIGMTIKRAKNKVYAGVPSAQLPLPRSENIPVPIVSRHVLRSSTSATTSTSTTTSTSVTASTVATSARPIDTHSNDPGPSTSNADKPILITQNELGEIVTQLELSQRESETFASFLKANHLLASGTKLPLLRNYQAEIQKCFKVNTEKTFAFCNDVGKLMESMGMKYEKDSWRLLIDSSETCLKAVLMHKTNAEPSVAVAYSTDTYESYDNLKRLLEAIKYNEHKWRIHCGLKILPVLSGLRAPNHVKFFCFACDWDSRFAGNHYAKHDWKKRSERKFKNDKDAIVPLDNIVFPFIELKLGVVKKFVKTVARRDYALRCLMNIFPTISHKKLQKGILDGRHIRKLLGCEEFDRVLVDYEFIAWKSIKAMITGLLNRDINSQNYENFVKQMLDAFETIGVEMTHKIHYMHQHLQYLSQHLPTKSDEQVERQHRITIPFELKYGENKAPDVILAKTCWWYKKMFEHYEGEEDDEEREPEDDLDYFPELYSSDDDEDDSDDDSGCESVSKRTRK